MSNSVLATTQKAAMVKVTPVASGVLQRQCACGQHTMGGECEECKDKQGLLQRKPANENAVGEIPPIVHEVLRSPGQSLDVETRAFMEPHFGHDFSQVWLHTDAKAAESARAVDAMAYTVGHDIVFGAGQYELGTSEGKKLLAHELTHVMQQSASTANSIGKLELGTMDNSLENEAEQTSVRAFENSVPFGAGSTNRAIVQRQSIPGLTGPSLPLFSPVNLPAETIELAAGETISVQNPQLVRIAQSFKSIQASNPAANIRLSASLSEASRMSSATAAQERSRLGERLFAIRDVLQSLGVPKEQISIEPPTAHSTSAHGQVSLGLFKAQQALPSLAPPSPLPIPGTGLPPQPKTAPGSPSLSDLLTLKFGPLTVELPKSVALQVPIPITSAKSLVIDLKAEASGTFSFSITLDGLPYVRVSVKTQVAYDKDKGTTGSAGLQIQAMRTVCSAANPDALKAKVTTAGDKLKKAMQEYGAETDNEKKLMKLPDVAGALGEMYDAVDKAKSGCKPVPAATFEFGAKGPLGPETETDPTKRQPSYLGGTLTIPF